MSLDKTIKVWDLKTFKVITTIEEESDNILKINENEFITSSSKNNCIKFWNNYQIIKTINDLKVTDIIKSILLFEDDKLLIGPGYILYLIDSKKYELVKSFEMNVLVLSISKYLDRDILCTIFNSNKNHKILKFHYDNVHLN